MMLLGQVKPVLMLLDHTKYAIQSTVQLWKSVGPSSQTELQAFATDMGPTEYELLPPSPRVVLPSSNFGMEQNRNVDDFNQIQWSRNEFGVQNVAEETIVTFDPTGGSELRTANPIVDHNRHLRGNHALDTSTGVAYNW
ncbi:hypothetical protein FRX31_022049, partial [Thalictrum thalictroides]